jgi:transposase InsO family protein
MEVSEQSKFIREQKKLWRVKTSKRECLIALKTQDEKDLWYVDSGCSKHMTGNKEKFLDLKKQKGKVTFGDNASSNILGKGTVSMGKDKARNVLLVDKLKPSLLSVSQTCDQGYFCNFDSQKCEIRKENMGKLVGISPRTPENVYILDAKLNEECHINYVDESWLWHRRLEHIKFDNLWKVRNLGAVRNLPKIIKPSNAMCRHCQLGKKDRVRFKTKEYTTSKPLDLVHADLCGPTRTKSIQGESYFKLFIDDFTRMSWICFLKEKLETLNKFKAFKTLVENEREKKIKCLRLDNGGEFTSKEFNVFCETHGIKIQFFAAKTPQQNGIPERKNRIVKEAAKLSDGYWRETISTTIYILNKCQLRVNSDKSPYELWFGRAPSVKYFKFFGSKCYIKILDESLEKFDARSDEGIFVGYASNKKAYRCYNLSSHNIFESADVKVDDLNPIRIKNQETISKNKDEDDDETFGTQLEEVEENEKEREEDDMDTSESEEDSEYGEIREELLRIDTQTPSIIIQKNHPEELIIGDMNDGVQTRR